MAQGAAREGGDAALRGVRVRLDRRTFALHFDPILAESGRGRAGELERVDLPGHRVVPAGFDPRRESELVDQRRELVCGQSDHLHIARHRLVEPFEAGERVRETVHSRERRPQVVRCEHHEVWKTRIFGHD